MTNKKRQLTQKEKEIVTKNLKYLSDELEYHKVISEQLELTIKNADILVKKQIRDKQAEKSNVDMTIKEHSNAIEILSDQLKSGVESKEADNQNKEKEVK